MPPAKPPVIAPSNRNALAGPLSSSPILRRMTNSTNSEIAITYPYSWNHFGGVSARVSPSTRGVWFEAASGHRFRHSPGATMKSSGSSGMTSFHITQSPVSGTTIRRPATASAAVRLTTRSACHAPTGSRDGICV